MGELRGFVARSGTVVSRMWAQGKIVHEQALRLRSCMCEHVNGIRLTRVQGRRRRETASWGEGAT
jgi:hypothetical protein